ncbi:hypothetical protein SAMN05518672_102649 [Chitinophaga sp. CF118]|uniref:hypothetical protein n=1 Tax=Chitinophaga sp. CF118 TaxID=1884367 RepID=UPI0008E92D10|nr:hypothetical protein [Chitinophaga sp. CF118]SFD62023.1 hypothetical protein SAMN05518672_102649 [Chitinophaga sp. CF118]
MRIVKKTGIIIFISLLFLLYTRKSLYYRFFPKADKYGVKYNVERKQRGILPLPINWTTRDFANETKIWFPPPAEMHEGVVRSMKLVRVNNDHIQYEEDHIAKTLNSGYATLSIGYNYDSIQHWCYTYIAPGYDKEDTLSRRDVDSILKMWNFNY